MRNPRLLWWMIAVIVVLALALPVRALAAAPGMLVLGDSFTLSSGEQLEESLTILGGNAVIEQGALLKGDIFLLGGRLKLDGTVDGDIAAAGGVLELGETAQVTGDISTAGVSVWKADGAVVEGEIIAEADETLRDLRANNLHLPLILDQALSPLAFLTRSLVAAALAMLVVMFFQQPVERVAKTLVSQPVLSGGMGLLTVVVFPLAFLMMILTILLIPLGFLSLLALACLYLYGWTAFGYEVGRRMAAMFHWDLAVPVMTGMGTLAVSLVFGVLGQIPCLGFLIAFLGWNVVLGAVILSRFGRQVF